MSRRSRSAAVPRFKKSAWQVIAILKIERELSQCHLLLPRPRRPLRALEPRRSQSRLCCPSRSPWMKTMSLKSSRKRVSDGFAIGGRPTKRTLCCLSQMPACSSEHHGARLLHVHLTTAASLPHHCTHSLFAAWGESKTGKDELEDWADDWDDDAQETDFDKQLRAELKKAVEGGAGSGAAAPGGSVMAT